MAAREGRVPLLRSNTNNSGNGGSGNGSTSDEYSQREKDLLLKFIRLLQGRLGFLQQHAAMVKIVVRPLQGASLLYSEVFKKNNLSFRIMNDQKFKMACSCTI